MIKLYWVGERYSSTRKYTHLYLKTDTKMIPSAEPETVLALIELRNRKIEVTQQDRGKDWCPVNGILLTEAMVGLSIPEVKLAVEAWVRLNIPLGG